MLQPGKLSKRCIHSPRNKQDPEHAEIIVLDILVNKMDFHCEALVLDKVLAGMVKMIL